MNRKDSSMKAYLSKPEIAADFYNVGFADGKQVFKPWNLQPFSTEQVLVAKKAQRYIRLLGFMDIAHYAKDVEWEDDIFDAFIDTEFQSTDDPLILLRCMNYMIAFCIIWMSRLDIDRTGKFPMPMALLVYTGKAPLNTEEFFENMVAFAPPVFKSFLTHFRLAAMDLRRMTPEDIGKFLTEAGCVVHCFPLEDEKDAFLNHLEHGMPRELSREGGYVLNANFNCGMEMPQTTEEKIVMCKAMREIRRDFINQGIGIGDKRGLKRGIAIGEQRGISIGRNEGISIGRDEGISIGEERVKYAVMQNAMAMGYSEKDIKRLLDLGTK